MRLIGEVNEGASATIVLSFVDEVGVTVTPMSGSYRIDTANGVSVRALTAFTPTGDEHSLALTPADNAVQDTSLITEPHIVTVTWVFSAGSKTGTEEFRYDVKNLLYL